MKHASFRVSRWQLTLLVFMVTVCVTPFAFDSVLVLYLHRQAWLALLPALAVGLLGSGVAGALAWRFRGVQIVEYVPRVLGPIGGRLFLFLLGLLLFAGAPLNLHVFARLVRHTELPRSSPFLIALIFAAIVAFACYFGPEVIARGTEVLAPLIGVGLLAIFFAPFAAARFVRLLPLTTGFPWHNYWLPVISSSLGTVRGFLTVLVLGGAVSEVRGLTGRTLAATAAACLLLILAAALPVLVLGVGFSEHLRFPILAVTGTINFRWLPFAHLTLATILIWQMIMFCVLAFYLWGGVYVLCAALGIADWRPWVVAGAAVTAYLGGTSPSPAVASWAVNAWNFAVIAVGVVLPLLLLLTTARGRRHSEAA